VCRNSLVLQGISNTIESSLQVIGGRRDRRKPGSRSRGDGRRKEEPGKPPKKRKVLGGIPHEESVHGRYQGYPETRRKMTFRWPM
jgi:hypothetical protein